MDVGRVDFARLRKGTFKTCNQKPQITEGKKKNPHNSVTIQIREVLLFPWRARARFLQSLFDCYTFLCKGHFK